jgi:hypothetical protein
MPPVQSVILGSYYLDFPMLSLFPHLHDLQIHSNLV